MAAAVGVQLRNGSVAARAVVTADAFMAATGTSILLLIRPEPHVAPLSGNV